MKTQDRIFYNLIKTALHPSNKITLSDEKKEQILSMLPELIYIADTHNATPLLYDALCSCNIALPQTMQQFFHKRVLAGCYQSYDMIAFTRRILQVLSDNDIVYFLLKGLSLLPDYPVFECRTFSDVDILITDSKEYTHARKLFLTMGFLSKEDLVDHHEELIFIENNVTYTLELHSKVINSQDNKQINKRTISIFQGLTPVKAHFAPADIYYQTLPPTETLLYLLLHMMQHFVSLGFGVKLLCDWTIYLEKHATEIDFTKFENYLDALGLFPFYQAMTELCVRYLGLSKKNCPLSAANTLPDAYLKDLLNDITRAGEFGHKNQNKIMITAKSGPLSSFLEVHRQMKNRFPTLYKTIILWPFLWTVTILGFFWNNRFLRNVNTKKILTNTRKRKRLFKKLHLLKKPKRRLP